MYLSKPILFIIIVVVLFIGGTSGLIQHVENSSSSSGKRRNSRGRNSNYNNRDNDKSSSSGSDESDSSDSDSDNDERRFSHVLNHKIRDTQSLYTGPGTGIRGLGLGLGLGGGASVEGFTASNNVKCMPGCKIATSISGNCKWIPGSEPKHKQRLICPHVCDTASKVDIPKCESNIDCSDCTPQPDFTVTSYVTTQIKNTTNNASCVKGKPCNITNTKALTICNPSKWPNSPSQNLVCTKKPGSSSEFVWTEADSAAKQIPLHADQAKVLACDAKQGCAVDGDSCMNANFDKIYCNDNIWVTDPKYDKSTYSTDKKGTGSSGSGSGSSGSGSGSGSGSSGSSGTGTDDLRDNYYITNYFFGPSKDAESSSTYKLGIGLGKDKKRRNRRDDNNDDGDDTEKKPGIIDKIKGALTKEKKVEASVGLGLYGNNYGIGGNATVPPIVPKGEVAVVQSYESTIKL
jgi:hypothetical protein